MASKRTHFSNMFLTINSNVRPHSKAEAVQIGREMQAIGRTFFTLDVIERMLQYKYDGNFSLVDKISVPRWSIELGTNKKGQRIHLHAFIKIVHHTWLNMNPKAIQAYFNDEFAERYPETPVRNVYVNIKWIPASEEMAIAYITKQQTGSGLGGEPGALEDDLSD